MKHMALILMILSFCWQSQAFEPAYGMKHGKSFRKIMKELNLTEEQKTKMNALKEARKEQKAIRLELRELKEHFQEALKANTNEGDLTAMHKQIQALKQKRADLIFSHLLEIRKILTPEQRLKFHELRDKYKKKNRNGAMKRMHNWSPQTI